MVSFLFFLLRQDLTWPRLNENITMQPKMTLNSWQSAGSQGRPPPPSAEIVGVYLQFVWCWGLNPGFHSARQAPCQMSDISSSLCPTYYSNETSTFDVSTIKKWSKIMKAPKDDMGAPENQIWDRTGHSGKAVATSSDLSSPLQYFDFKSIWWFLEEACFLCSDLDFCWRLSSSNRVALFHITSRFFPCTNMEISLPPLTGCLWVMGGKNKS